MLNATSVLLTYQSDWGLLVSAPGKCQGWSEEEITKYVGQLSCVSEICSLFHLHAVALAKLLYVSAWACGVEICFQTWEKEGQLRLHGHLFFEKWCYSDSV